MTGMPNPKVERAIIRGDALRLPLRDNTVDLIVTSPPYLWKRKYAIDGTGELGNERDWRAFLNNLFAVTDEMLRVLKTTGSIWVNLGDTRVTGREPKWLGIPVKSKLLLPERYRVGCQDRYASRGVIVRQVQVWGKGNGLPESVTDRTRDSHEDWVHLVKQPRYYAALDEIREPHTAEPKTRTGDSGRSKNLGRDDLGKGAGSGWSTFANGEIKPSFHNPLGKLPGSVWTIPSEPLRLPPWIDAQHYAAFPSEWPRRLILAFSPPGICSVCGQGRFPVVERDQATRTALRELPHNPGRVGMFAARARDTDPEVDAASSGLSRPGWRKLGEPQDTILGYACGCTPHTDHPATGGNRRNRDHQPMPDARPQGTYGRHQAGEYEASGPWQEYHLDRWAPPPTHPAIILDPFGGTGCSAHVARALGRIGISVDLSEAYCRLAADATLAQQRAAKVQSRVWPERQGVLL